MAKLFNLKLIKTQQELVTNINFRLGKDDLLERKMETNYDDQFAHDNESPSLVGYVKQSLKKLISPTLSNDGPSRFIIITVLLYIYSFFKKLLMFLPIINFFVAAFHYLIKRPFLRGWRLEVVRNVALESDTKIPSIRPDKLLKYTYKGFALFMMRSIYFLPVVIISFLSGPDIITFVREAISYFWEEGAAQRGPMGFIVGFVIPQIAMDMLVQLVLTGLYALFVWPVYRIIMIQYAVGEVRGGAFLNSDAVKKGIAIFRRNAREVYGIYGFVLALDIFMIWGATVLTAVTVGLFSIFVAPLYYLFFRFWVKGYAYGKLGQVLIRKGEIVPKLAAQPAPPPPPVQTSELV